MFLMSDSYNGGEVAVATGLDSAAGANSVCVPTLGIDPRSNNANIFAAREPYLHELHHGMNWDADLFPVLSFYRLRESSVQIYSNPPAHSYSSTICGLHSLSLLNLFLPPPSPQVHTLSPLRFSLIP